MVATFFSKHETNFYLQVHPSFISPLVRWSPPHIFTFSRLGSPYVRYTTAADVLSFFTDHLVSSVLKSTPLTLFETFHSHVHPLRSESPLVKQFIRFPQIPTFSSTAYALCWRTQVFLFTMPHSFIRILPFRSRLLTWQGKYWVRSTICYCCWFAVLTPFALSIPLPRTTRSGFAVIATTFRATSSRNFATVSSERTCEALSHLLQTHSVQ